VDRGEVIVTPSVMQAVLLPPCKGGADPLLGEMLTGVASADATKPIDNASGQRFAFGQGQGDHDERSRAPRATKHVHLSRRSPKKRRIDENPMFSVVFTFSRIG
jgi:hypothetical protein